MDLKKRANGRPLTVTFDEGEKIELTFNPNAITPAFLAELQTRKIGEEGSDVAQGAAAAGLVVDTLAQVLASWDLTDGGEPIPLTREGIASVPLDILSKILKEVNTATSPNPATPTPSSPS